MFSIFSIGYTNSVIFLFIFSGLYVLLVDVRHYRKTNFKKETKVASFLGWLNIFLGAGTFVGDWVYHAYFW